MAKYASELLDSLLLEDISIAYGLIKKYSDIKEIDLLRKIINESKNGNSFYYGKDSIRILDKQTVSSLLELIGIDANKRNDILNMMEKRFSIPLICRDFTEIHPDCFEQNEKK